MVEHASIKFDNDVEEQRKPVVKKLNIFLIARMLEELGLPKTDDIKQGQMMIELYLADDKEALAHFRESLVQRISVEFIALSDGTERLASQVSFRSGEKRSFVAQRKISSTRLTPSETTIKERRGRDLQIIIQQNLLSMAKSVKFRSRPSINLAKMDLGPTSAKNSFEKSFNAAAIDFNSLSEEEKKSQSSKRSSEKNYCVQGASRQIPYQLEWEDPNEDQSDDSNAPAQNIPSDSSDDKIVSKKQKHGHPKRPNQDLQKKNPELEQDPNQAVVDNHSQEQQYDIQCRSPSSIDASGSDDFSECSFDSLDLEETLAANVNSSAATETVSRKTGEQLFDSNKHGRVGRKFDR